MFLSIFRGIPVNFIVIICFIIFIFSHSRFSTSIDNLPELPDLPQLSSYFNRSKNRVHTVYAPSEYCPTAVVQVSCPSPKPIELPCPIPKIQEVPGKKTIEQETIAKMREEGIVVVFKTGAQEISQVAIHLGTTLRYFEEADILFFSDLQTTIGSFVVNDALKTVDQNIRLNHKDFDIYHTLQSYQSTGQDILELKEDKAKGDGREGWRLDKYKFIHMVEQTFLMRPAAKWYLFIETDSYVVWPNLVTWMKKYDSRKPWYLGAAVMMGDTLFAHGGSGYVLSNAAMNKLLGPEQPQGLAASWDAKMDGECCGDVALAKALKEQGVKLTAAHPYLNGYKPSTFTYGPRDHWCQPVVSMHHLAPLDISSVWRFERQREMLLESSNATTFSELYFHFVEPHLMESRDNWDNLSDETMYTVEDLDAEIFEEESEEEEEVRDEQEELWREKQGFRKLDNEEIRLEDDKQLEDKEEPEDNFKESTEDEESTTPKLHKRSDKPRLTPLEKEAHKSFEACREVCASKEDCFQWLYYSKTCRLELSFRLGHYRAPEKREGKEIGLINQKRDERSEGEREEMVTFKSGWMVEKIREWSEGNRCEGAVWV